jgi:hypothetical protein
MKNAMTEGWNGDDYLMLFSADEAEAASERYGIGALLPGYRIVGDRRDIPLDLTHEAAVWDQPTAKENTTWVPFAQHADVVRWWNTLYRDLKAKPCPAR